MILVGDFEYVANHLFHRDYSVQILPPLSFRPPVRGSFNIGSLGAHRLIYAIAITLKLFYHL